MTYKLELFLVLYKKEKEKEDSKIENHSKIMFFMVYLYWTSCFLH